MKKKILVLFPNDWDKAEFSKNRYTEKYTFIFEGVNLFEFPYYFKLPFFQVQKFIKKLIGKAEKENLDAVLSSDEYIGAIITAIIARKLGLPHADPSKIILAQHKYFSRLVQTKYCSEASVNCSLIDQKIAQDFETGLPFPFFVKPVKGTFSLFAKKVSDVRDLKKHLNFNWFEKVVLNTITKPYNQLLKD